jgi:SAM-dependent methyltransferase
MSMRDSVKAYYGDTLQSTANLKSDACCEIAAPSPGVQAALTNIHPEVSARYYGCGLVAPETIAGARVLDLGCGTGRDVYLLAQLAGADGEVVGVDMTENQLAVAREHQAWHAKRFGYANTRFLTGYIEDLGTLGLEPESFDLVVSNCVVNLSEDKPAVFEGVRKLLKPGGVMHFADVYARRPAPAALKSDPVLYGECLAGALAWEDFLAMAKAAGFAAPRLVDHRPLAITDPAILEKLDGLDFVSATVEMGPGAVSACAKTADPFETPSLHAPSTGCC